MKRKIIHIIGARPQFVKVALVTEAGCLFRGLESVIVHTGQHYDTKMSGIFFRQLKIPKPKYNMGVGERLYTDQIAKMLEALDSILAKESPDMVFVYGDTNSTLAGALAAAKMNIPLAHVEAGLRSFDMTMPEEVNRVATDRLSDILFCPTKTAVANLRMEGITRGVFLVSDIMMDMLARYSSIADRRSRIVTRLHQVKRGYYLATVHRAANTDNVKRLRSIMQALGSLDKPVIFPVHPRTQKVIGACKIPVGKKIIMIKPVSYIDMLMLEKNAAAVLTDSGGVQKEAFFFKVPCVTLRQETEWVETLESGWNILAGIEPDKIRRAIKRFSSCCRKGEGSYFKGTGSSAKKILEIAIRYMKGQR